MFLEAIVQATRARLEAARSQTSLPELVRRCRDLPPTRAVPQGPFLIAEVKRASPSRGDIAPDADAAAVARGYVAQGAHALSCLTEPVFFKARPDDFASVRAAVDVPVLRKDFVLDPYQVWETRAMGADLVLLIVRVVGPALPDLLAAAEEAGLAALVEVHRADELEQALAAGARLVGVNSRDLDTFHVDLEAARCLLASFRGPVKVAESGLKDPETVARMLEVADGVLIGEEAMRRPDLIAAVVRGGARGCS
jgi:indole-3-glycerol phosphate synthase